MIGGGRPAHPVRQRGAAAAPESPLRSMQGADRLPAGLAAALAGLGANPAMLMLAGMAGSSQVR
jgi:hypothetical protein